MVRNLSGLKLSARSRSDEALSRASLAIRQMKSDEVEINFRSVAARAGVSTAWLYRTKPLRDKIMKARTTSPAVAGEAPQYRQRLSHERIVATLRLRIKTLEGRQSRAEGTTRGRLWTTCCCCSEGKTHTSFTWKRRANPHK